jgi:hypothetical protein
VTDEGSRGPGKGGGPADDSAAEARTPLEGFASGGIGGLIEALAATSEMLQDDGVDDPEALRRAEEAVAHDDPLPDGPRSHIDEDWTVVARQTGTLVVGLDEVARMLEAEDVAIGWDPYDPRDSVAFLPPGIGTGPKSYAIVVPASQLARAREVLYGVAPDGVTYEWEGGRGQRSRVAADAENPLLSDNQRLQRAAGGGPSGLAIALAIGAGLLVLGIVFFVLLRG